MTLHVPGREEVLVLAALGWIVLGAPGLAFLATRVRRPLPAEGSRGAAP